MMIQKYISVKGLDSVIRVAPARFVQALATVSLGTLLLMASHAQNLIANGSFETPISNNSWGYNPTTWFAGQTFSGGWTVEFGSIDIKRHPVPGNVPAYDGVQWVDLNGSPGRSAIYQDFTVSTDGLYTLRFAMNGNYAYTQRDYRQLRVQILQGATILFSQDYTHIYDNSFAYDNQPWEVHSVNLTLAAGPYRLRFESLETRNEGWGPALDDVRLELVPEPASMVALGTGLASLLGLRRRRQR